MDEVRWLSEDEQRAWSLMQMMQIRLTAELARQLAADSGLSYQDYVVLVVLTAQPDGRLRLFELGQALGWEKSRVSHHITRMTSRNLVTKEKCGDDRRGAFIVVTEHGRREIEAAAPGHIASVRALFIDQLTPVQLEAIAEVSETILAVLDPKCRARAREDSRLGIAP